MRPEPDSIPVVGAAIVAHGCCLAARRSAAVGLAGRWEFPGGKVEPGESPEAALRREIREELGVEIEVVAPLGTGASREGGRAIALAVYLCRLTAGTPRPREHDALRWLGPDELGDLDWAPADTPLLPPLAAILRRGSPAPVPVPDPEASAMGEPFVAIPTRLGVFRARFTAAGELAELYVPETAPPAGGNAPATGAVATALARQLEEYAAGRRREFDLPLALTGTPFQRAVWAELQRIPYGGTISYGELARRAGRPAAIRAAGQACGANPVSLVVPCHRVVSRDGRLTGYGGGLPWKRYLLEFEGALDVSGRAHPEA